MMKRIIDLLIIILVGLIPILWFKDSQIILGHDSGLVLSPLTHFLDRLFVWTDRFGLGHDQTYATAGFFIHGFEALLFWMGFTLQQIQKITFVFWFLLPGITMYIFASYLSKRLDLRYLSLPASIFYMLNHFIMQGWFIAERTKFSLYAALPLLMLFLFEWIDNKRGTLKTAVYLSITIFLLNGGASFPLFGGIFICIFVFVIYYFYKRKIFVSSVVRLLHLGLLIFVISSFLNSYWLFPLVGYILNSYAAAVESVGGIGGVLTWVSTISQDTSLINLFRLQGIPEWYQNPGHPYSNVFLNNPLFVVVSYIIPILAFMSLVFIRKKKYTFMIFFVILALVSMFFVGGSHPPFGVIYILFVSFVPGFVAFRTPFYKFAPALWFSYAILISFTISYLLNYRIKNEYIKLSIVILFCAGIILYNYPVLTGVFFDYVKDERTTRVEVPKYVLDFRDWIDNNPQDGKILSIPPANRENKIEAYDWGYWSVSPITSLITNAPIVNRSGMSEQELNLTDHLFSQMKENNPNWINLAKILGIDSFLVKKDFLNNSLGSLTDSYSRYEAAMSKADLVRSFDKWDLYSLDYIEMNESRVHRLKGSPEDIGIIAGLPSFDFKDIVVLDKDTSNIDLSISNDYIISQCVRCNLQKEPLNKDLYRPLITQGSFLYPIISRNNLDTENGLAGTAAINYYMYKSLNEILAFDRVIVENKETESIPAIITEYERLLHKLEQYTEDELKINPLSNNDLLIRVNDILSIQEDTILSNTPEVKDKAILEKIYQAYRQLIKLKGVIGENTWLTTEEESKKLLFSIDQPGEYELFYKPNDDIDQEQLSYSLNKQGFTVIPDTLVGGWLSLGNLSLEPDTYQLELGQPAINLSTSASNFIVESNADGSCYETNLIDAHLGQFYRISFDHRLVEGNKKFYIKVLTAKERPNIIDSSDIVINTYTTWSKYVLDYEVNKINNEAFYIAICNTPEVDVNFNTRLEIKDFTIHKIAVPNVVLLKRGEGKIYERLHADKINNTKYIVNSSEKEGIFILNESFNANWQTENDKSLKFPVNGYANAWLIPPKEVAVISYKSQVFAFIGFIISGISLVGIIVYLVFSRLFKNNDKKN